MDSKYKTRSEKRREGVKGKLETFPKQGLAKGDIKINTDLNPTDHFSVGQDNRQPLLGRVSDPNLRSLDPLTMQTDRSRQQLSQVPESEEMSSSPPTEPEPSSPQREEDKHPEDRPCAIDSNSGTSTTANKQNMSSANLIPITINNEAINASGKKLSINREMKRNLGIEETSAMPPSLKRRLKDQGNQYAAEMKSGGIQMFDEVQQSDVTTQTERILCENINETFQRRPTEVKNNDLNTHHSPCLISEGDIDPTDLNPIDQFDVNVSVGQDDCQSLLWLVSDPNLRGSDPLPMQTDRSRQQVPQVPESEEMSSSPPTEPEPSSPQREEDKHQEDRPCAIDSHVLLEKRIPITMDNFNELRHISGLELRFKLVMKRISEIEPGFSMYAPMPSFLNHPLLEKDNQFSFGAIEMESGEIQLLDVVKRTDVKTHTERVSCTNIDETLQRCGTEVKNIYIFTLNSPCLMREHKIDKKDKHKEPCMLHLLEKAYQWHSTFDIRTRVFFKKPWGLSGPGTFKGLLYSDVSRTSSAFHPYVDLCKEHRFTLDDKFRPDNQDIFRLIGKVNSKEKLKKTIESILRNLQEKAKRRLKKSQHLENGREYINSHTFPREVHDTLIDILTNDWDQMVNDSSMSLIKEKITSDFNDAVVKLTVRDIRLDLGNSGYFQLFQVPPGAEVEE